MANTQPLYHPLAGQGYISSDRDDHAGRPKADRIHWESFKGVDLKVPVGTPVYAVADGVISPPKTPAEGFGASPSPDPRFAGNRLHLVTSDNTFYYQHLSKLAPDIKPGQPVVRGQLLGYTGVGGGEPHLHFAALHGNTEALVNGATHETPPGYYDAVPVGDELNDVVPMAGVELTDSWLAPQPSDWEPTAAVLALDGNTAIDQGHSVLEAAFPPEDLGLTPITTDAVFVGTDLGLTPIAADAGFGLFDAGHGQHNEFGTTSSAALDDSPGGHDSGPWGDW